MVRATAAGTYVLGLKWRQGEGALVCATAGETWPEYTPISAAADSPTSR